MCESGNKNTIVCKIHRTKLNVSFHKHSIFVQWNLENFSKLYVFLASINRNGKHQQIGSYNHFFIHNRIKNSDIDLAIRVRFIHKLNLRFIFRFVMNEHCSFIPQFRIIFFPETISSNVTIHNVSIHFGN